MLNDFLEAMYRKGSSPQDCRRIPNILSNYEEKWCGLVAAFVEHHQQGNRESRHSSMKSAQDRGPRPARCGSA